MPATEMPPAAENPPAEMPTKGKNIVFQVQRN